MVGKQWHKITKYLKDNSGDHSKAPDNLHELLQKITTTINSRAEETATKRQRKQKLESERRKRQSLAVERVSERSSAEDSGKHPQVSSSYSRPPPNPPPDPPPDPPDAPAQPPAPLHTPNDHKCWSACKRVCVWGGPGPEKWCRSCDHWSWHFPCPAVMGGACQRCICLAKAAARDTKFKHSLGGTCCAYLDGTACEC
jgi:hypothetical protein